MRGDQINEMRHQKQKKKENNKRAEGDSVGRVRGMVQQFEPLELNEGIIKSVVVVRSSGRGIGATAAVGFDKLNWKVA
jgi:hypothetical protein